MSKNNIKTSFKTIVKNHEYFYTIKIHLISLILLINCFNIYAFKKYSTFSDTSIANIYLADADTFTANSQFDSAIILIEKAAEIYKLNGNWTQNMLCFKKIGGNYSRKGDYTEAMNYALKALNICETYNITDSVEVSGIYHLMGIINYYKGNYPKALEYYKKKLNTLGNDEHQSNIGTYNNVAVIYKKLGDYYSALEYLNKALNINLSQLVENKIFTANVYHNLGTTFSELNEFDQAFECFKKAIKIKKEVLGNEHLALANSYRSLGNNYLSRINYDSAMYYYNLSLSVTLKTLGQNHPDIGGIYLNIGNYYIESKKDFQKALEYYYKALTIYKNTFGNLHPEISHIYQKLGLIHSEQHNYEIALKNYQEAIIALVENFTSQNIYVNPIIAKAYKPGKPVEIENVGSPLDLFNALLSKAAAFENLFYYTLKEKK